MPMRDPWPCDSALGASLGMNSAGSCDGIISVNSGYSDDSMEHLSAEERACLMFLEETIDSLAVQDDSGVSTGEFDHNLTNKMAHFSSVSQVNPKGLSVHDDPNKVLGKNHNRLLVPTPLVLANGNAKLLKRASTSGKTPAVLVNTPKTAALNSHQYSPVLTSTDETAISAPNHGRPEPNAYSSSTLTDLPPPFIPEPPVKSDTSSGVIAKDNHLKSTLDPWANQKQKSISPNIPMDLLPPPSDFMDEPVLLPPVHTLAAGQPQKAIQPPSQLASQFPSQLFQNENIQIAPPPTFDGHFDTNTLPTPQSSSPRGQLSISDLDNLRKKPSLKKVTEKVPAVPVKGGHTVSDQPVSSTISPDTSSVTVVDYGEPKSPPSVAPKPKKLPSSIVLKSYKDPLPTHSLVSPGDRMANNQQKVHLEALKKLGLLRSDEIDSGLSPSPPHKASPLTSFSAASPSVDSPDSSLVHAEHHAVVDAQGKTHFSFLPAPHDKGEHLLITRAPSPKPFEMKSASMEWSGTSRKSFTLENPSRITGQKDSPENVALQLGHLQNNRLRPSAMENRSDLSSDQTPSESNRELLYRRSLPISAPSPAQPRSEPQKSLRSHRISVLISPQSKNTEDRKQALRRLGLGSS